MSVEIEPGGTGAVISRLVVSVSDLDRALTFYQGLVGLSAHRREPGFAYLVTADGLEVLLHERPAQPSAAAVAITFRVTDLDAVAGGVEPAGGTVLKPVERQPWGERMAVVRDPDGHIVCFTEA